MNSESLAVGLSFQPQRIPAYAEILPVGESFTDNSGFLDPGGFYVRQEYDLVTGGQDLSNGREGESLDGNSRREGQPKEQDRSLAGVLDSLEIDRQFPHAGDLKPGRGVSVFLIGGYRGENYPVDKLTAYTAAFAAHLDLEIILVDSPEYPGNAQEAGTPQEENVLRGRLGLESLLKNRVGFVGLPESESSEGGELALDRGEFFEGKAEAGERARLRVFNFNQAPEYFFTTAKSDDRATGEIDSLAAALFRETDLVNFQEGNGLPGIFQENRGRGEFIKETTKLPAICKDKLDRGCGIVFGRSLWSFPAEPRETYEPAPRSQGQDANPPAASVPLGRSSQIRVPWRELRNTS